MATSAEAWASALEASVACAVAMAVDVAASRDWAMAVAMEAKDLSAAALLIMEDVDYLAFIKILCESNILLFHEWPCYNWVQPLDQ